MKTEKSSKISLARYIELFQRQIGKSVPFQSEESLFNIFPSKRYSPLATKFLSS